MKRTTLLAVTCGLALFVPVRASAQNREQQQTFAELRSLQQQVQDLQLAVNALADSVKKSSDALTSHVNDRFDVVTKTLADQKLDVSSLADSERTLRAKLDESNVRIGTLAQSIETVRQAVSSLKTSVQQALAPPPADGSDILAGYTNAVTPPADAGAAPPASTTAPATGGASSTSGAGNPPPAPSATGQDQKRIYDQAFSEYVGGQYDLAIQGMNLFLKTVAPKSAYTDFAQYYIGQSYYMLAKNQEAIQAFTTLVTDYKGMSLEPDAYYLRGMAYQRLGQKDKAADDFRYVIKNFPDSDQKPLAEQALARIK